MLAQVVDARKARGSKKRHAALSDAQDAGAPEVGISDVIEKLKVVDDEGRQRKRPRIVVIDAACVELASGLDRPPSIDDLK